MTKAGSLVDVRYPTKKYFQTQLRMPLFCVGVGSFCCSNSTYTYDDRGLMLTKTDARGLATTYSCNDRGFEVSRTEASGMPLARIATTIKAGN